LLNRKIQYKSQVTYYIGIIDPAGCTRGFDPGTGMGNPCGGTGVVIDIGFGAGQRLKFVVFPLNALMLKDSFAEGCSDANADEEDEGVKDIL
jgi:hypothetical protein